MVSYIAYQGEDEGASNGGSAGAPPCPRDLSSDRWMVGENGDCVVPVLTFLSGKRKVRGQKYPLTIQHDRIDQASTQTLTVEAYYEGIGQEGNGQNQQDPDYWGDWMRHHYETNLKPRFANQSWTWDKFTKLSRDDKDDFEFWLICADYLSPLLPRQRTADPRALGN